MRQRRTLLLIALLGALALVALAGCEDGAIPKDVQAQLTQAAATPGSRAASRATVQSIISDATAASAALPAVASPDASPTEVAAVLPTPPSTESPYPVPAAAGPTSATKGTMAYPIPTLNRQPAAAESSGGASPTPRLPAATSAPPEPENAIGRIQIPKLGIDAPITEVSWHLESRDGRTIGIWDTAQAGAGYHRGTAAFGGPGNSVISGHSRSAQGGVFYGIWDLLPGDTITLVNATGELYRYAVESTHKLEELGASLEERHASASFMAPTEDTRLTLITCWPDWAYTHRILVIARPG